MDCQTAIEYINLHVDNVLDDAGTQRLFEHIRSCEQCRKELEDTVMLKRALSDMDELEPPAGLALSAIKKAKKRRIPVFAYASTAVAAVIALVAIFSSSIFPNNYGSSTGSVALDMKYAAQEIEAPEAAAEPNMAAPEATGAPAEVENGETSTLGLGAPEDSIVRSEFDAGIAVSITVPSEASAGLRDSVGSFINEYGITPEQADGSIIVFTVPEEGLQKLKSILSSTGLTYEGEITAGSRIEFLFEK